MPSTFFYPTNQFPTIATSLQSWPTLKSIRLTLHQCPSRPATPRLAVVTTRKLLLPIEENWQTYNLFFSSKGHGESAGNFTGRNWPSGRLNFRQYRLMSVLSGHLHTTVYIWPKSLRLFFIFTCTGKSAGFFISVEIVKIGHRMNFYFDTKDGKSTVMQVGRNIADNITKAIS